jgi:hypothetical protein
MLHAMGGARSARAANSPLQACGLEESRGKSARPRIAPLFSHVRRPFLVQCQAGRALSSGGCGRLLENELSGRLYFVEAPRGRNMGRQNALGRDFGGPLP